ncbi:VirD4-like conjugal transfer protein, CD1115 family [Anaeromicropila herbilytica]|uniref:Uncharacterized protein n=1 Tax=Anaeromicropila herbilytica TaxID=2785025 RepID=A0A7R7IBD5_9FIRM|nr:type IV secretory system conjugative DNA transfer family protein [Anaeromicropila herbilytica]BCN29523.1 hypothetical protein bsdtb5_08180 [Anaeromicropila herbilytica]
MKLKKLIPYLFLSFVGIIASLYFAALLDTLLSKKRFESYQMIEIIKIVASSKNASKLFLCLLLGLLLCVVVLMLSDTKDYQSKQIIVTPDISTPVVAGQGQCGTAKWLDLNQFEKVFATSLIDKNHPLMDWLREHALDDISGELQRIEQLEEDISNLQNELEHSQGDSNLKQDLEEKIDIKVQQLTDQSLVIRPKETDLNFDFKNIPINVLNNMEGGMVLGKKDNKLGELLYYINEDVHTLILGATRAGKGRCIVIQTLCFLALALENILCFDPKGENYDYTKPLLQALGYDTILIDFKNPKMSTRFNFLQPIIDCIDQEDIPGAIDATWDLVSQLVGEPKGERLWTDGEASNIAGSIMAVCYDNRAPENHKYRNLQNVYYFISQMCTPVQVGNVMVVPLNKYTKDLPYDHPSKALFAVGEIAPSRTRGSFYTSSLMTLKLFTNPLIAEMTSISDYDCMKIGNKKTAIFIMLPDDRKTYYTLASLYVSQLYQLLSKAADLRGGRLKRRFNFVLDEFGQYAKIPPFTSMMTVGGGKGIRFNLFLQAFSQLDEIYEKEAAKTIKSNCENWIYLQSDDGDTRKDLSEKLGKYTISTYSLSANHQKFSNPSSSHNISLTGRDLLTPDEIKKIKRPYSLVTSRNDPAIFYAPDLVNWSFNSILGLGSKEHNRRLRLARGNIRYRREVSSKPVLWGIWDQYIEAIKEEQKEKERKKMEEMAKMMAMQSSSDSFYS